MTHLTPKSKDEPKYKKNSKDRQRPVFPDLRQGLKCGGFKHVLWDHNLSIEYKQN